MIEMKYKVYCDMDGVLTDFNKSYEKLTGIDIGGQHFTSEDFWNPINDAGYDFWINMEWLEDGKTLWNRIKKYNPELLSAPSRQSHSRIGKSDWVKRELDGVVLNLRYSKHKKDFADTNHILIDDRLENILSWVDAGGIGIHHMTLEDTINKLEKLGL
jgi:PAS domain-containing protein